MRNVKLFIATSLDSYIAGPNGEIDWLFTEGDFGYEAFLAGTDTTLMGYETYKLISGFDDFPYKGLKNYVFTRNPDRPAAQYVEFVPEAPASFVASLKQQKGNDIFLVGGGQMNALLLEAGLIDEMQLFIHPIVLGNGIPLFQPIPKAVSWAFVHSKSYDNGLVELLYRKQ